MERINIAQVDIDVEALINKSAEVRQRIMEVSDQMKALKDALNKGGISVQEYTRQMALLQNVQRENQREQRAYDNLISSHIAVQHQTMQANNTLTGSIRELGTALAQNRRIYEDFTQAQRESAEGKQLLETIHAQDEAYRELQRSIGVTQVDVGNYRQAILDALGDNQAFGTSMNGIVNSFNNLRVNVIALSTPFVNFVQTGRLAPAALNATAAATGNVSTGMKILRGSIIATGIGALVVVLGSLIAYFTSTQEGIDKVNKVLTPLKVVFQTLIGVVQNFGKYLLEAITHPKQMLIDLLDFLKGQFMNRLNGMIDIFKGIGKIITGDIKEGIKQVGEAAAQTVTGVENVVGKVKDAGKAMSDTIDEAVKRGQRIEEISVKLASSEADFVKQSEALKLEFEEQNQIARDTSNTLKEREIAAKKSIELQKELNKLVTDRKNLEVEIIELKQQSNDTSDKERTELEEKRAEINKAKSEQIHSEIAQTKLLNNIHKAANDQANAQAKEAADKARAHLEEQLKWQKEAVEEYIKTNSAVAKSLQERLAIEEKGMQDRLAILEKEKSKGLIKKNEYEKQKIEIEEAYLKTRVELSIEAVKKEAEQYEAQNKTKIESETRLTAELIVQEQARQDAIYQKKVEALEKEKQLKQEARAWDYNAEDAYQQQLQELKEGYDEKAKELSKQQSEIDKEEKKTQQELDFQDKLLTLQEQGAMQWEVEAEQMRQNHEQEREALSELLANNQISQEEYNKRLSILNQKHAQDEINLKRKTEETKVQLASAALSQAKQLFGEHTAVGKAAAIAEAMINTYLGITKALSAYPPPYNAIMAGVTGAMGMLNVKKIMETDVKYEKGGLLKGKSHNEGGIPFTVAGRGGFEAEGGEYIVNKRATAMYFPVLEAINRSVGYGNYNPVYMAAGGVIKQIPDAQIDYKEMMNAIKEGAMQGTQAGAYEGSMQGALQGTQQGAFEGARAGSLEGSMQGAFEGATMGTTSGITDSILRISDNERARQSASI
jgi:chromosome segregation ATPase-like protein|nr:MAG TPA: Tail tape measure [Caudoviricetes sp.]